MPSEMEVCILQQVDAGTDKLSGVPRVQSWH